VTVATRNPSATPWRHERLRVVEADVMRPEALDDRVEGQHAATTSVSVISALREGRKPTTLCSEGTTEGTSNVIEAMKRRGVGRLVCISSCTWRSWFFAFYEEDPSRGCSRDCSNGKSSRKSQKKRPLKDTYWL